jgi:hypothetical protein
MTEKGLFRLFTILSRSFHLLKPLFSATPVRIHDYSHCGGGMKPKGWDGRIKAITPIIQETSHGPCPTKKCWLNYLIHEKSPFLLQHVKPVDQSLGEEAFQKAKKETN